MAVETRWWHTERNKVVCTLCPRDCHIPEGSRGFCFVRANVGGKLELTTDGRSSGFCIDPIEKKPLNHFLPGTPILSFGTAGCNLGCKFCQNWDISKSREMDKLADEAAPEAIIEAAKQSGCRSVAFTYNDPVIWAEYAIEISKVARREGIKTVAVTAGYISPPARKEFYQWIDAANVDLKAFTETFYRSLTKTHLEPVLDTLKYLKHETDVWFEITNLIIPGENDSPEETTRMCQWIVDHLGDEVPVHFTAFHPDFKMMDKPQTPHETLIVARQIALDIGIKYPYVGNVYDKHRQSTYCPVCDEVLIERDWYELGRYNLDGNQCDNCAERIPGVFEAARGDWGRKRVPVTIRKSHGDIKVTVRSPRPRASQKQINGAARTSRLSEVMGQATESTMQPKTNTGPSGTSGATETVVAPAAPAAPPKIDFSEDEAQQILAFTRAVVDATVAGVTCEAKLPTLIDQAPAYGIFVSLRRVNQLRACRGRWGGEETSNLGKLLASVAADAATMDPRFPAVTDQELGRLALDISLMFNPQQISATGEDRIGAVAVGKHGLVISHPHGRGLLLPHVATDANWDAKAFLDGLCRKAGLPQDAWRRDNSAQLMTFEARLLTSGAPTQELDSISLNGRRLQELIEHANQYLRGLPLSDDVHELLTEKHEEELGLCIYTASGLTSTAIGNGQSLNDLAEVAVRSLNELCEKKGKDPTPITRLNLLWQPIGLRHQDYPQRHRSMAGCAVLARHDGRWSLVIPSRNGHPDRIASALANLKIGLDDWKMKNAQLTAFSVVNFEARQRPSGAKVRQPARAGQFYPGDVAGMVKAVDQYLDSGRRDAGENAEMNLRAIMLPHAGWQFCAQTIGKTLARTAVPDTVIIIGPKHTPYGENWSVAPHTQWDIPGASIPIATELAEELAEKVNALQCEPEAHRMEHGSEVLVPFLHRINPNVRVLPIVIGQSNYESTGVLAGALAELCWPDNGGQDRSSAPLLIISSDMNHFATEPENRRLDHMALDAMGRGDPRQLYESCQQHQISMCGFIPACIIMQALLKQSPQLKPELVHYCNSADTTGDTSRVVGYAGVLFE